MNQAIAGFAIVTTAGGLTGGIALSYSGVMAGSGLTTLGLSGSGEAVSAIEITQQGLQHVIARHVLSGLRTAGKSIFNAGEDVVSLIRQAEAVQPVQQAGGNFARVVNAGRTIGIDRATGQPTSIYTVITNAAGKLVTAFPGTP